MVRLGRPTRNRTTELGRYIEQLRHERGWSLRDLAREAEAPYKTLCKLEVESKSVRRPEILLKIARALGVHPNQLLVRAVLTPMLSPSPSTGPPPEQLRPPSTFYVTEQERVQLEHYLNFLRDSELMEMVEQL